MTAIIEKRIQQKNLIHKYNNWINNIFIKKQVDNLSLNNNLLNKEYKKKKNGIKLFRKQISKIIICKQLYIKNLLNGNYQFVDLINQWIIILNKVNILIKINNIRNH